MLIFPLMNKRTSSGLIIGVIAGTIDVIPMIIQNLPSNADLSAFTMWVVIGYFLSITSFKLKGWLKGLVLSFLVLLPSLFIIGWKGPVSLVPIFIMTTILGSLSGFVYQRLIKE